MSQSAKDTGKPPKPRDFAHVDEAIKIARTMFLALLLAAVYCALSVASTSDGELIAGSTKLLLPILEVPVPVTKYYFIAPMLMLVLYVYFHSYLLKIWFWIRDLPLKHPTDRRNIVDYLYPWLIAIAFVTNSVTALRSEQSLGGRFLSWAVVVVVWGIVPAVLFMFWGRYLVRQHWGSYVHAVLLSLSLAAACAFFVWPRFQLRRLGKESEGSKRWLWSVAAVVGLIWGGVTATAVWLTHESTTGSAITVVADSNCSAEDAACEKYSVSRRILELLDFSPVADISGADLSGRPEDWAERIDQLLKWPDSDANGGEGEADNAIGEGSQPRSPRTEMAGDNPLERLLGGLRKLDMKGRSLRYAQAHRAFLAGADLSFADLKFAEFSLASLQGVTFECADLRAVQFERARIGWACLSAADLTGANMKYASMYGARLQYADFDKANLTSVDLTGADATGATFVDSYSPEAILDGISCQHCKFDDAFLLETSFVGSTLRGASFKDAILVEAKFTNSDLTKVDLNDANLSNADLTGASFCNAKMSTTKGLTQEQLLKACGNGKTRLPNELWIPFCVEPRCPGETTEIEKTQDDKGNGKQNSGLKQQLDDLPPWAGPKSTRCEKSTLPSNLQCRDWIGLTSLEYEPRAAGGSGLASMR